MRVLALLAVFFLPLSAAVQPVKRVELLCHRTANKDAPENTMESLQVAVLFGCDVVEIDVRRTLDGVLVLNHDGFTERLTEGGGEVEQSLFDDLRQREAGAWMGERWRGLHMATLDEALLFAKEHHVELILDIKNRGIAEDVLRAVDEIGMRSSIRFGGEWSAIRSRVADQNADTGAVWVMAGTSLEEIRKLRAEGKRVIVNFSANAYETDLTAMKLAVAAGADAINVDFPRIGADAVGRPVEVRVAQLVESASRGDRRARVRAIAELAHYRGFPLQERFLDWLQDPDEGISRAAAVALSTQRPLPLPAIFLPALGAQNSGPRMSAAWALGILHADASLLVPHLQDADASVSEQILYALAQMNGPVSQDVLLPWLSNSSPRVRGAAAVALATKQPELAAVLLPDRLRGEMHETLRRYENWMASGKPRLSRADIREITDSHRGEMKFLQAIRSLPGEAPVPILEELAFHSGDDFLQNHALVAEFQLWDRIGADPDTAVGHLGDADGQVAGRAEWMLTMADARVEGPVRSALSSPNPLVRQRAIRIAAFRGDRAALPLLERMTEEPSAAWAIEKIHLLRDLPLTRP